MSKVPQYISKLKKKENLQHLINEALYILDKLGIPLERITLRRKERYWNNHFDEKDSDSSYDDIRRKDLKLIVLAGIINSSSANKNAARNDGTRSYALNTEYIDLIKKFGDLNWEQEVENFLSNRETLEEQLSETRDIDIIPVILPS